MSGGPLGLNRERAQSQTAPGHPGPDTTSLQGKGAFLSFVSCRLDKGRLRLFLLPGEACACACVGARARPGTCRQAAGGGMPVASPAVCDAEFLTSYGLRQRE